MSVLRQLNVLGQQRLDVPHIRSIESAVAADFDVLAGRVQGGGKPLVIRGFTLSNYSASTPATGIQLNTADGIIYNMNASEAGTFLWVPADRAVETLNSATNSRVQGGFTAGQTNYIGLDLVRTADDSTSDLVQFLDPNTLLEQPKSVPLARTLDYRIVISTTPFSASSNVIPIAKVVTDAQNQVASATNSVQDARSIMWRLGSGGDFPNTYGAYSWAQSRLEYDPLVGSLSGLDKFSGGDKGITSQKDWMDAVMSRIWEIGGGQNWYSPVADRNVKMTKAPGTVFTSTADNFEWVAGLYASTHLHWQGLKIVFENSNVPGVYYNAIADQVSDDAAGSAALSKTALAIGDCIYVDIDRTSNAVGVVAKKAAIQTLGTPTIPGSRIILAWRDTSGFVFVRDTSFPVNTSFAPATTVAIGAVRLAYAAGTPGTPTVPPLDANNAMSIGTGSYPIVGNNVALTLVGGGSAGGLTVTGGTTGPGATISTNAGSSGTGLLLNVFNGGRGVDISAVTGQGLRITSAGTGAGGAGIEVNHSGSGIGLKINKTSSGAGLEIDATGGSGIALNVSGGGSTAAVSIGSARTSGLPALTVQGGPGDGFTVGGGSAATFVGGDAGSNPVVGSFTGGFGISVFGGVGFGHNGTGSAGGAGGKGGTFIAGAGGSIVASGTGAAGLGGSGLEVTGGAGGNNVSSANAGNGGTGLFLVGGAGGINSGGGIWGSGGTGLAVVGGNAQGGAGVPGAAIVASAGGGGSGNANAITATPSGTGFALDASKRIKVHQGSSSAVEIFSPASSAGSVISSVNPLLITADLTNLNESFPYTPGFPSNILISGGGSNTGGSGAVQILNQTSTASFSYALEVMQWNGASYSQIAYVDKDGKGSFGGLRVGGAGHALFLGGNPAISTGFSNTLTPNNIIKAWGYVLVSGSPPYTVQAGFNVASVGIQSLSGGLTLEVTLTTGANAANRLTAVVTPAITSSAGYAYSAAADLSNASKFYINGYRTNNTQIDFDDGGLYYLNFICMGPQ